MTSRARYEHQIKLFGKIGGRAFDDALTHLAFEHGLEWFTDDQVEDMRDYLIERSWFSHKLNRQNRKFFASLSASQKEQA